MRQYCSVCRNELEMEVVPTADGEEDGVIWLRCPGCQGYLPKIDSTGLASRLRATGGAPAGEGAEGDGAEAPEVSTAAADWAAQNVADDEEDVPAVAVEKAAASPEAAEAPPPLTLDESDLSLAVPYRPWETYEVGAVIHHLAWDDFGVVLAKEKLPGRRQAIKVQFAKSGVVRLIEQSPEEH